MLAKKKHRAGSTKLGAASAHCVDHGGGASHRGSARRGAAIEQGDDWDDGEARENAGRDPLAMAEAR